MAIKNFNAEKLILSTLVNDSSPDKVLSMSIGGDLKTTVISPATIDASSEVLSTGLNSGGAISINGVDGAKFDISAGAGIIVDHSTSPPTYVEVSWGAFSSQTITNLATNFSTDIAINNVGAIVQQTSFTDEELRSLIFLGGIDHNNKIDIDDTFSVTVPTKAVGSSVRELARAVGDINLDGNGYSANGANLNINKSAGLVFSYGRNFLTNVDSPHKITTALDTVVSFGTVHNNGSGTGTFSIDTTTIDPDQYDNGTGTLAAVPVNRFTIQRFLLFPNNNKTFVQYGVDTYNSLNNALDAIPRTAFVSLAGIKTAMIRGYLVVQEGETDLTNATFLSADKFGNVSSLSSGVLSTFAELTDTTVTAVAANEILKWDGAGWINNTLAEAGISATGHTHVIADITDFTDNSSTWDTLVSYPGDQTITLTGDVTGSGTGSFATVIAVDAVDIAMLSATGTPTASNFLRGDNTWAAPAGSGDMVLADGQTVSGIKTFLNTTMKLRNVANTFDGYFVNTNTADRIYTLKDAAGTLAFVSDITGINSGTNTGDNAANTTYANDYRAANFVAETDYSAQIHANITALDAVTGINTGDQTDLTGISDTKLNFDSTLSDGTFMYTGDAPTAHTHTFASLTSKPTTISGYGITDFVSLGDAEWAQLSHTHVLADIPLITATVAEVNLLDLAGLTAGWILSADSATTASWKSPAAASGDVATDTIWDLAGDLAVGTGADTASRLAMGTTLQVLRVNAGATALEWAEPAAGGTASLDKAIFQTTHGFAVDNAIKHNGTIWVKAQADTPSNAGTLGIVSAVADANNFTYQFGGLLAGAWTNNLTYFLDPAVAGNIIAEPTYSIGEVREFIGTGTPDGLLLELDLGDEIVTPATGATQLIELSDVTTAVQTAGFAIMSSGGNYAGRAIVEADISDFGTYSVTSHTHALPDLTDVVTATNTDKFVMVANGTTGYVGRLLIETDISDLGSYSVTGHTHVIANITDFTDNSTTWDALNTNVSTNLSEGTSTLTTVDVNSSDGTNATLLEASTLRAGLLGKAKWDEIVVNNGKATNVSTDLSMGTVDGTQYVINSSDGTNVSLPLANATNWGIISDEIFNEIVVNNGKTSNIIQTDLSSISDTMANFDSSVSDGSFAYQAQTIVAGNHGTGTTDEVINFCYGTSATPPAVGTVTEGAVYIQYTA